MHPYIFEKSRQYIIKSGRDLFFSLFAVAVVRRRSHIDPGTLAGAEPAANPQQKIIHPATCLWSFPTCSLEYIITLHCHITLLLDIQQSSPLHGSHSLLVARLHCARALGCHANLVCHRHTRSNHPLYGKRLKRHFYHPFFQFNLFLNREGVALV